MKTETKVIKGRQGIARNRHTPLCLGLLLALSPLAAAVADARKDGETELPDMVISGESTSATQSPGVTTLGKVPLKPRELPQSASPPVSSTMSASNSRTCSASTKPCSRPPGSPCSRSSC